MKKAALIIAVLLILTMIVFTGCDSLIRTSNNRVTGSENLETRQYDFSDFTRVDIGSAFYYEIEQADSYSISITADDNIFEHIQVKQDGETLRVGLEPFFSFGSVTLEAYITMPRLAGLESSGATRGTVSGFNSNDNVDLDVSGASRVELDSITTGDIAGEVTGASRLTGDITAGDIDLQISGASNVRLNGTVQDMLLDASGASNIEGNINAGNTDFRLSGASGIDLEGSANDVVVDASGASRIKLGDFPVSTADITLSGASSCNLDVSTRIDINLSGTSKLVYKGDASVGSISTSSGSSIKHEDADD
jgi:hypothetical protein